MNTIKVLLISLVLLTGTTVFAQSLEEARKLSLSERYEDAENMYKQLVQKEPNNANIFFYYGVAMINSYLADTFSNSLADVIKESQDIFKKGVAADSLNPLNYVGLGMSVLMKNGDTAKANNYFNKAESFVPKNKKKCTEIHVETLIRLGLAQIYGKNKRHAKGIAYLQKAALAADKNPQVYLATGDIYIDKNDGSNAILNYNKALYIDPKSPVSQIKIGDIYMSAKNINEARKYLEKAQEIDSTFAPVYKYLGQMWSMAGKNVLSKNNYKKFLELSGNNIPVKVSYLNSLFKAKDYSETIIVAAEILAVDNSRNYINRIAAYSCYEKKPTGEYEKGLQYIETFFAKTTPDKIIAKDYSYYGKIQLKVKKDSIMIDNAFVNLMKAYGMDTSDNDLLKEIINNYYNFKKYDKAAEMQLVKIAKSGGNNDDYMFLGKCYYQNKNYTLTEQTFRSIIAKDQENLQAWLWLANTKAAMDPDSKDGLAKPIFDTIILKGQADPVKNQKELFDAYKYMGSYYLFTKKDNEKAEENFSKILVLDPNNKYYQIQGNMSLGILYTQKKDYKKAISFYDKVIALDPNNQGAIKARETLQKILNNRKPA